MELGKNQNRDRHMLENGNDLVQMDMVFIYRLSILQKARNTKESGKMVLSMVLELNSIEIQGMFTWAIFIMASLKVKGSTSGHQEQSMKAISKKDKSMGLVNGKREWEMELMFSKANMSKTNVAGMEFLNGD